jgi:two-component system phosphate regulon sensor histidine kinase PhoR
MTDAHDPENLIYRNQLLSEEIRRRVDQLAAINTVAATVSQSLDLNVTLETALDAVLKVIPVDSAGISLVDDAAGELVLRAQRGWRYDFVTRPMRIPLGQGMSGIVVREDEVLVTGNVASGDPRLAVPEFAHEDVQAMAMAPMHARGRVVGILSVMNHTTYEFGEDQIAVLRVIADQVGIALDNARLFEHTKEQSSRLSAVLNSSGDAIVATDSRGHINLVNATTEALFDLDAEDLIGLPLRNAPLHPKLRDGLRRAMSRESEGNTVFEVTLDDGRFLSAIVSPVYAQPLLEGGQQAEGWVMVIQDITHLREAEQTRVNFIQAAAHDLRNPLSVTLSSLKLLASDPGEKADLNRDIIDMGIRGLNRMQDLIDSLLNLEHIQSGVGMECKPVDVRELIERAVIDIQHSLQEANQQLRLDVPHELPVLMGDMHWLHRALLNLLSNANKYTPPGGEITLRACVQDEDLSLEVQDNGPGIPPEAQTRLFERFYRVPGNDTQAKGSGLGLAIVRTVVEQHGGRVFVQSRLGQGSIFGMIFPLTVPPCP